MLSQPALPILYILAPLRNRGDATFKNLRRMGQVIHSDVSGKVTAPRGGEIEEMEKEERRESGGGARGGGSGAGGRWRWGGEGGGQRLKTYGCG